MMKIISVILFSSVYLNVAHADVFGLGFGDRLSRKAERLEKRLELKLVEIHTAKDDDCSVSQLREFIRNFRGATDAGRSAIVQKMNRIDGLQVERTKQSGIMEGEKSVLGYQYCSGGYKTFSCQIFTKVIGDKTFIKGTAAQTKFTKEGNQVAVRSEFMIDAHSETYYLTSPQTFKKIDNVDSAEFKDAFNTGRIVFNGRRTLDSVVCGTLSLGDLLKFIEN